MSGPDQASSTKHTSTKHRLVISIGGMTCAACVNTITTELKKRDGVSNIVVSLVTNSASIDLEERSTSDEIVEAIEDLGYEATISTLVRLGEHASSAKQRTVQIRVDGTYCEKCPVRIRELLAGFHRPLECVTHPLEQSTIADVTYIPEAPIFTIRHILAAIEASDDALTASIYHPPTLEERSKEIVHRHQLQLLRRVILSAILSIPTFVLGIVFMSLVPDASPFKRYLMEPWKFGISRVQLLLFIFATPAYFFGADLFHVRAFKEILVLWRPGSKTPLLQRFYRFGSMNLLISLGTTIAYASSVARLIAAVVMQPTAVNNDDFYFDTVVFLTLFLLIGRLIESSCKAQASNAVEMLGRLRPTTAILIEDRGAENERDTEVDADLLDFGDIIRVPNGASPAADGIVIQGESSFDESSLTGEARLVRKNKGDEVFSGTINMGHSVLVQVTGVGGKSLLDGIVDVVREGQDKLAPVQQVADTLVAYFVPVITLVALTTWLTWMSLGLSGAIPREWLTSSSADWFTWSLQFAIAVFIVACPCGLALAAPTAVFVGSGIAAKLGVLAKGGGEAFEKASKIDCVVFDKTGTLTTGGEPCVADVQIHSDVPELEDINSEVLFAALKGVEKSSKHPVARAVVTFCESKTLGNAVIDDAHEVPGKGMKAIFKGETVEDSFEILVGNEALMADSFVHIPPSIASVLRDWKTQAKSVVLVATKYIYPRIGFPAPGFTLATVLSISDLIRPETPAVIRTLRARGISVWLLSGDNPITAAAVALQAGIDSNNVIAGVLPAEKAEKILHLQSTLNADKCNPKDQSASAKVARVGDGINDSPALSTADVGIAIGSGSDVAISCADFVLLNSDLHGVVYTLDLSRAVLRRIKLNFAWALVYNCVAVPVAAGCFYPIVTRAGHVRLDPVWASLAMALSSVSVVLSSLALRITLPWVGYRKG